MPFTTTAFAVFFAVTFFGFHALPGRWKAPFLLGASWAFYAWASPFYLLLLLGTAGVTFAANAWMRSVHARRDAAVAAAGSREEKKAARAAAERRTGLILGGAACILLATLGFFKYLQFAYDNLAAALGWFGAAPEPRVFGILLPVGLSFYTFQSIGYCIDVRRETEEAERSFLRHALFVSYFPQIMQGPIGRHGTLAPQLSAGKPFDYEETVLGLQRVAWGVFKKFMIANPIADRIDPCWAAAGSHSGAVLWGTVAVLYAIQLYADFSGYMDIACGCSRTLGIRLDENFDCPYFARNVPEFWRRWHITLGTWFKDYLFYPILRSETVGGLRRRFASKLAANAVPVTAALAVVWAATGLWHGASWGYVAWGVYYGLFIIAGVWTEPLRKRFAAAFPRLTESRAYTAFTMARTFAIVAVGYTIFKPGDLAVTGEIWRQAVCGSEAEGLRAVGRLFRDGFAWTLLWAGVFFAADAWHYAHGRGTVRAFLRRRAWWIRWGVYAAGTALVVYLGLYGEGYQQFEYFKF